MQLSLWQQFSSNHSGFFWVVGTFKTTEAAEATYEELRDILQQIDRWHQDNPEASRQAQLTISDLVPPEKAIALKYDVEWPRSIDWTGWAMYHAQQSQDLWNTREYARQLIDEAVTLVGNIVTVSNPHQTWMGIQPFAGLLEKLGSPSVTGFDLELVEAGTEYDEWGCVLSCVAQSVSSARELQSTLREYLEDTEPISMKPLPPWDEYTANFKKTLDAGSVLRKRQIDVLLRAENWRHEHTVEPYRSKRRRELLAVQGGAIRREGTGLIMQLGYVRELTLAAIIAYLEVHNCTDIECRYVRSDEPGEE